MRRPGGGDGPAQVAAYLTPACSASIRRCWTGRRPLRASSHAVRAGLGVDVGPVYRHCLPARLPPWQISLALTTTPGKVGTMSMSDPQQVWEEHYTERDRVWSGRANVRLTQVAGALPPGRALDLGCGEGGDAMWLAE